MTFDRAILNLFAREPQTLESFRSMSPGAIDELRRLVTCNFGDTSDWLKAKPDLLFIKSELRGHIRLGRVCNLTRLQRDVA